MGPVENQPLYGRLDDSQKKGLNAIKRRIESFGKRSLDSRTGDPVIEILESWLMDDEQKQNLLANAWDIYFLYAAAGLISLIDTDGAGNPAGSDSSKNITLISPSPEPTKAIWPSFDVADGQQAEILELIGQGYLAASTMAEEIPPRVAYDGDNLVNIQLLAACLRLAMGFNWRHLVL